MSFTRVGLAILAVLTLFLIWRWLELRFDGSRSPPARGSLAALSTESILLTLFAGLWFGSLGAGGVVWLFLLLGALMEIPLRLRSQAWAELPWKSVAAGIGRIVVAGWVLKAIMG
jgi:hypothetical protein